MKVATFLEGLSEIEKVLYPGLPSHPQHNNALKNRSSDKYSGGSGMMSFHVNGDLEQTKKFLAGLKLVKMAFSLGDV